MKVVELIRASSSLLSILAGANVMASDVKYLCMYDDYCRMKSEGHKVVYIVAMLSDVFGVSEKTVYNVIKKFEKEI